MKLVLFIALCVCHTRFYTFATPARHPLTFHGRILDGNLAEKGQFPWHAFLMCYRKESCGSCGGSLINPKFILTAAHCTEDRDRFDIWLGSNQKYEPELKLQSTVKFEHPLWNTITLQNDVSLIKLPKDVQSTPNIRPISLPNQDIGLLEKTIVTASGFGTTGYGKSSALILNHINLKVISNKKCLEYYSRTYIHPTTLCAFAMNPTQTLCHGDSGGPLVTKIGDNDILVGVISFTFSKCSLAGPTGYSRVTSYLDWINHIIDTK